MPRDYPSTEAKNSKSDRMTDGELAALIERENENAIGADDYTASQRATAIEYYHGDKSGVLAAPSTPNRSSVVSKDILDVVEWAMPALMDMFASSDDVVRFLPDGPEDERSAEDATNYIGYLMNRRNNGFVTLHDAIKSALVCRMGVTKTYVEEAYEIKEERYEGLSQPELDALLGDEELELLEQVSETPAMLDPSMPPELQTKHSVVVRCKYPTKNFKWEGVPPEEIRIAKDTRCIEDCRFISHRREVTQSDLMSMGYDKKKISGIMSERLDRDDERQARHNYDGSWVDVDEDRDESQRTVVISEAYIKVDTDGDGVAEYRRVVECHGYILENDVVDDHPFSLFTPILMPYKVVGLSMWDLLSDLQEIKTALMRQLLDNAYLTNINRTEVVEGQVNLDDLLQPQPGGIVRVKSPAMMREITTNSILQPGLALLSAIDQTRDTRSGVTETNSALNAESLAKGEMGSQGVEAMMQAGVQRIRLVARVLAETGMKRAYLLMLKLVTQHTNRAEQVKINGRWLEIDPREWKSRYNLETSVGVGTFSRQQQVSNLTLLGQAQKEALQIGLASPANIYTTLVKLAHAMGYRDGEAFFTAPDPNNPPQMGGEDDGSAEAQALIQAEQIKAQAVMQKAQMDNQVKLQIAQAELQSKERVAMFEAQERLKLEREKMMADIAQAQAQIEVQREQIAQNHEHQMHVLAAKQESERESRQEY